MPKRQKQRAILRNSLLVPKLEASPDLTRRRKSSEVRILRKSDSIGELVPRRPSPSKVNFQLDTSEESDEQTVDDSCETKQTIFVEHCNNPCISALDIYYKSEIPAKGTKATFTVSRYLNALEFDRPYLDEEEELFAEWGLPLTFCYIPFEILVTMLSAILLERKVLILCENMRVLSAVVLSIPALIRPFVYQSAVITMLPETQVDFLEAVVPFIMGMVKRPCDIPEDVVVVDIFRKEIHSNENIPSLPNPRALYPFLLLKFYVQLFQCSFSLTNFYKEEV